VARYAKSDDRGDQALRSLGVTFTAISEIFSRWIDSVCDVAAGVLGQFVSQHTVRLIEEGHDEFVLQASGQASSSKIASERIRIPEGRTSHDLLPATLAGNNIEVILRPDRFLFRPIELPDRAAEFMSGIVRSQIDRITPWNAADSAFGWSEPVKADTERIVVTVAATTFASIKPYVQAITDIGVRSIAVFTFLPEAAPDAQPIKVWEQKSQSAGDIGRTRRALVIILATISIAAGIAFATDIVAGTFLTAQQDELARQISGIRSASSGGRGSIATAQHALEQRKHEVPSSVLVLETLSKILPDQTYVTELRLEGNKLRLIGITRDAPSLIGLIERSGRFTRASFFAPTTRSPSNTGDRFHIEAIINTAGPST
jgi:general secretion pathway protein L